MPITSRINPTKNISMEKRMMKHETINVGNLGTSPVWKYSSNTGMKKDNPNNAKNKLKIEKKQNGL